MRVCLRDVGTAEDAAAEQAEATARTAAEMLDSLESISDMYIGVDADWRMTYINGQAETRLGVSREDAVGQDIWVRFPSLVGSDFEAVYRQVARTGRPATLEARYDEADLWCEARVYPLRRGGIAIYFRDISERRAQEQERERLLVAERAAREAADRAQRVLAHRARHDELTGLLSRAGLRFEVERVLADRPDARGHPGVRRPGPVHAGQRQPGARRRRPAAGRVRPAPGRPGGSGRCGGPLRRRRVRRGARGPDRRGGRLLRRGDRRRRPGADRRGSRLLVTASVGLTAACPADLDILLREADAALHRAKDDGRDRAVWFDEQMHVESVRRVELENDLRQALDRDELFVEYQPAFDLREERICHVEALVRWRHPVRGLVGPQDFIPVAEETGLVGRIGEMVLARAVEQARRWRHLPGLRVWVNVSPQQLVDRSFPARVAAELDRAGLPSTAWASR